MRALAGVVVVIWLSCMAMLGGCDDMSIRGRVPDTVGFSENVERP